MSRDSIYLFEQTDFSLRFVRCAAGEQSLRIEELKEVSAEEAAAFIAALPSNTLILCASRPKVRGLHLARVDEAKRHAGFAGIRQFAELSSTNGAVKSIAAVKASDGSAPTDAPWLLSSSTELDSPIVVGLRALKSKQLENISATLATAGAFVGSAKRTMLLIEMGELGSHAMLVGPEGVLAAGGIPLDLLRIGEAVQTE
ncbi:MAG TPA: hypothetical protein VL069_05315, partial [Opitutus sp.]|nr:hypothetical protein [Opitutus sp.]